MLKPVRRPHAAEIVRDIEARFVAANPKSLAQFKQAGRSLPGGNTRIALHYDPFPIAIERAQGGWLYDHDGHAYRDFMNDLTAGLYGHSHPAIIGALKGALDQGISFGAPNLYEDRLAAAIRERFHSIEKVRFCNSGTEANLLAVQLARVTTGRSKVLGFSSGYHGSLISFVPGLTALNVASSDIVLARFNDVASFEQVARAAGKDLAAVIVEPMLGSGGTILADEQFLAALRALTRELGAVLIFDEVQTARLAYGGLQEVFGIDADLTTLGKFVGGGLAFGAVGGRSDLMDRFDPSRPDRLGHGGTFNNNILTMVAGYTGLTKVATRDALQALNDRSDRLRRRLDSVARSTGVPLLTGGYGSIIALQFQSSEPGNPEQLATPPLWRKLVHLELLLRGIYAARRGTINLSLETSEPDCEVFASVLASCLEDHGHDFEAFAAGS